MSTTLHVFPDTNVFLHFAALDGLDWCSLCSSDEVVIHISQPLLAELNKVKEVGYTKSVRKRAASVQRRLREFLSAEGMTGQLRAGVKVKLEDKSPNLSDYPELNPAISDDVLIGSILDFCARTGESTAIATDDSGLALVVKAAKWKIRVFEPPQSARLPEEPDEDQKQSERLRKRLAQLEGALPELRLTFGNGTTTARFGESIPDIESEISAALSDERSKRRPLPIPQTPVRLERMTLAQAAMLGQGYSQLLRNDPDEVRKYNTQLDQYLSDFEDVTRRNVEIKRRMARIDLQVENFGRAPAIDVSVDMHFPDGMKLFEEDDCEDLFVELPEPPNLPGYAPGFARVLSPHLTDFPTIRPFNANAPSLSIRRTNSYDVNWHVPKLRQEHISKIDPMVIFFDTHPTSFHIDYMIVADKLPETIKGQLHVVVP